MWGMSMQVLLEVRRGHQIPKNWRYRTFDLWMLRTDLGLLQEQQAQAIGPSLEPLLLLLIMGYRLIFRTCHVFVLVC